MVAAVAALSGDRDGCPLTERELYAAEVVGAHYRLKLRRVVIGVAVAILISVVGTTVGWTLTRNESLHRTNDIQTSRLQLLIETCEASNARNLNTKDAIDDLVKHPSARERRSIASTKLIVDALAPFTPDCRGVARTRLHDRSP